MAGSAYEVLARGGRVVDHFGAAALVQALLDVEAALAQSRAAAGHVEEAIALTIAGVCKVGLFDHASMLAAGALRGNLAAEVADRLRDTVALFDAAAAAEVHRDLGDSDALQLAQRFLLRRALAVLDEHLSTIADGLAAQIDACATASDAAEQVLRLQDRIRIAGETALRWASFDTDGSSAAAAAADRCARRLQLAVPDSTHPVAPSLQGDDAMSLLLCALARAGADLDRAASVMRAHAGSAVAGTTYARMARAEQLVRAAAVRAPHRVAAWLACIGAGHHLTEAAAAEAAALIESTLAAAGLLAEIVLEMPPKAGAESAASTSPGGERVRRARTASPWQQWLG